MRVSSVIILFFGLALALAVYASEDEKKSDVEVVAEAIEAAERRTRHPHPTRGPRPTRGSRRPHHLWRRNRKHRRHHGSTTPASIVQKREAGFDVQVVEAGHTGRPHSHGTRRPHRHHPRRHHRRHHHHESTTPVSLVEKREAGFNVLVEVEAAGKGRSPVTRKANGGGRKPAPHKRNHKGGKGVTRKQKN